MLANGMIIYMLIITIIVSYITFTPILGIDAPHIKNHLNKLYGSVLIGLIVGLTDLVIHYEEFSTENFLIWIIFFVTTILIFYYLIIHQIFVDEKEYLLALVESHAIDLKMSNKLLENKNLSHDTKEFINKLIINREFEEEQLNSLLNKIN